MRYRGSKRTVGKYIYGAILEDLNYKEPAQIIEPFLGGANFTSQIIEAGYRGEIVAGDFDQDLNFMWRKVNEGWLPKIEEKPSKEEYLEMKNSDFNADPIRGFSRSACAWGGVPWNKYETSRYDACVRSIAKQAAILKSSNLTIIGGSYEEYEKYITEDSIIYCDPPYVDTAGYGNHFDSEAFWVWVEKISANTRVYVSELTAPSIFKEIWSADLIHSGKGNHTKKVTEKLFTI